MEGHKNKAMILVSEINRVSEENQKLKSMVKSMTSKYNYLQKYMRSLVQQEEKRIDRSQIYIPDHQSKDVSCLGSINVDSGRAVSLQSHQSSSCYNEQGGVMEKKIFKFMDDQQLPSKKRKIHYMQSEQIENGINSSADDSPCCHGESPNKMHKREPGRGSGKQAAATPRRFVVMRAKSEESARGDGCQWLKYGQKMTRNNPLPRSYYKCAWAPPCPVKKKVQGCAENPTIVVTTYEGEHTHPLSPLAIAVMYASSTNQLNNEGLNSTDNRLMPIARISASSTVPTITLDLTDNRPNPGLQLQPANLAAGSFQHSTPLPNNQSQLDHSAIMNSVASMKADPNFTAALAVAIAGSMLNLDDLVKGMMPRSPPATNG